MVKPVTELASAVNPAPTKRLKYLPFSFILVAPVYALVCGLPVATLVRQVRLTHHCDIIAAEYPTQTCRMMPRQRRTARWSTLM